MKNNKGFTLIEMLVVVAIIGILSATVLVALGPSREKARDSRIIGAVQQGRALIEASYDATQNLYNVAPTGIQTLINEVDKQIGTTGNLKTVPASTPGAEYMIYSPLITLSGDAQPQWFCADSTGFSGTILSNPAAKTACP